ncbi:cyclic pyranopterin monophosphate synthase MoaC [Acidiferrobacter thiooxydans]|jgi:cyclic pyranopterin phosphate synthase|uniref:Cyclic pyranopterin monophosphate synthase n=1 Tax=Acidiferrobacter thiooxydans TaxID=163359 RepID=A0A1C2G1K8_9GAMM|nr:cyclic pyranopterin monophosphate synthase MoaC [Acidiferrobacter thiooxydans]RCN56270.1 cyclic pyranopterin monophosphate synthase MoaC [Acidiferrobacter thiooxydans]UEN98440.1 cyclic pyranopterin monophosphate synthase MoaC [Acidiferrobacter thiooxydans]
MADENENGGLTHFDAHGQARMVDVTEKATTSRVAVAEGRITMALETADTIRAGTIRKGDVLGVARLAAIQAAKRTDALIPLCHQVPISGLDVSWDFVDATCLRCSVSVRTRYMTGVEMEALTAVGIALLTVYDMCKVMDRGMVIDGIRLVHKEGGRSGTWDRT